MKKVAIISCDKWINKLEEDINLRNQLIEFGVDARIVSWQQSMDDNYDLLLLRSVWGYQNYYNEFKKWLLSIKNSDMFLVNDVDMILNNIMKDVQFDILRKNNIDYINTLFLDYFALCNSGFIDTLDDKPYVIKPSISGSGENTFLINNSVINNVPNIIKREDVLEKYKLILESNPDCKIMVQPFVSEINNGEYSCVFIDGELTHTMLRFPNIFHEKQKPYLISDVPNAVLELAYKIEQIPEFNNYLYMRVDIVLVDGKAKIMEVELTEPDLLTKYILDEKEKDRVIKTFAKKIIRRIR